MENVLKDASYYREIASLAVSGKVMEILEKLDKEFMSRSETGEKMMGFAINGLSEYTFVGYFNLFRLTECDRELVIDEIIDKLRKRNFEVEKEEGQIRLIAWD